MEKHFVIEADIYPQVVHYSELKKEDEILYEGNSCMDAALQCERICLIRDNVSVKIITPKNIKGVLCSLCNN